MNDVERARRVRAVIEGCERIAADRSETDERRELASRWLHKLMFPGITGYASETFLTTGDVGRERHKNSGGMSLNADARYDGWDTQA